MNISSHDYEHKEVQEVLDQLEVTSNGLTREQYEKRSKEFGLNEVEEKKQNSILLFLKRFWGPMPWLLELTIILYLVIQKYVEAIVAFLLLLINAIIGFVQSQNSKKAVHLLKRQLEIECPVLRDDKWEMVNSKTLVPGDVIKIKLGDLIPADVYVLEGEMSLDVSSLTGESLPRKVNKSSVAYSGSVVKSGGATALVINTAKNTYFGKTVSLVQIAKPKSAQQDIMFQIVRHMMYLGILASIVLTVYALIIHKEVVDIFSLIIVFLMSAVPVALPAVMAIIQSVGAMKLSKKGVLITRLEAVEDAASIDVFCFDKTGTITQNKLSIQDVYSAKGYTKNDLLIYGTLASNQTEFDAIDEVIIAETKRLSLSLEGYEQIEYLPFDPINKKTEAKISKNGKIIKISKGSPQIIENLCLNDPNFDKKSFDRKVADFSKHGYRSIAVAIDLEGQGNYLMVGLLALADPIHEETVEMIAKIKSFGIRPMMLTGDNLAIAKEIAKEAGIGENIYPIDVLLNALEEDRLKLIQNSDGFAEVYPENKYEIIRILQKAGHVVGMTGDGVNDSPALKQAELGVAVSGASDVAKASASAVLTEPGLSEILETIIVSRGTFQRIMTWVMNKITKVVEVVILFTIGYFIFQDMIISLLGMTLLVFANDFVTISIATDNVRPSKEPNKWKMKGLVVTALVVGLLFALEDLLIAFIALKFFHVDLLTLQTLMMFALVLNTQIRIMTIRERGFFFASAPKWSLVLISIVILAIFIFISLSGLIVPSFSPWLILITFGVGLLFMVFMDLIKYLMFKSFKIN